MINPKLFSLIRNLTSNLTSATRSSAFGTETRGEDRNPGNAKVEYNVLLTAQLFTTKKKKRLRNLVPAAKYVMSRRQGRNLRRLFKLRKLEYKISLINLRWPKTKSLYEYKMWSGKQLLFHLNLTCEQSD